jgi:threonine dehydrogenase-like Zn-dependent dehydrogenase
MRAATLLAPGRFALEEGLPEPSPGEGEVVIAVDGCGVCASNLGPWQGVHGITFPLEPGAPGHEVYGRVAALGHGVTELREGDPVTALSYRGFAEFDVALAEAVLPLPSKLAGQAVLGEPLACAVNVARRAGVAPGDTVVVLGIGFMGALLLPLLRQAEPARVIAVSRRASGIEMAGRLGADTALTADRDVVALVSDLTGGRMADVVIEATGKAGPLGLAAELTRVRGRLVIAGYHQDGPRSINLQLWNWRGLDVINAHERDPAVYRQGMAEGIELMAHGHLDLAPLLTHHFALDRIEEAFAMTSDRPHGFFKAVVSPGTAA